MNIFFSLSHSSFPFLSPSPYSHPAVSALIHTHTPTHTHTPFIKSGLTSGRYLNWLETTILLKVVTTLQNIALKSVYSIFVFMHYNDTFPLHKTTTFAEHAIKWLCGCTHITASHKHTIKCYLWSIYFFTKTRYFFSSITKMSHFLIPVKLLFMCIVHLSFLLQLFLNLTG